MAVRKVIAGGTVVTAEETMSADILVEGEQVVQIGKDLSVIGDAEVIDATGMYVFPGAIDPHTHLESYWDGMRTADDWFSGTLAAAAGGTTTVLDFCRPMPEESMTHAFDEWMLRAQHKAVTDYGFHMVLRSAKSDVLNEMERIVNKGIASFKVFMAYKDSLQLGDADIYTIMQKVKNLGALLMAHCENGDMIESLTSQIRQKEPITDPIHHALSRPSVLEGEATGRLLKIASLAEVPVYIPHVTCTDALEEIRSAIRRGQVVFSETCPQYLVFDVSDLLKPDFEGAKYVCSPPVREKCHQDELWNAIKEQVISTTGSDHSSYNWHGQKDIGRQDFTKIPNGVPTIEDRLSILYHFGVVQGKISLNRFVDLTSTRAAKIFGLYPKKGTIMPGGDADLVIWDPNKTRVLSAKSHHMNVDHNVFEGMFVQGSPVRTMIRGNTVVNNGQFVGSPGYGKFLARSGAV